MLFRGKAPLPFAVVKFSQPRLKLCVQIYPAFQLGNGTSWRAVWEVL